MAKAKLESTFLIAALDKVTTMAEVSAASKAKRIHISRLDIPGQGGELSI